MDLFEYTLTRAVASQVAGKEKLLNTTFTVQPGKPDRLIEEADLQSIEQSVDVAVGERLDKTLRDIAIQDIFEDGEKIRKTSNVKVPTRSGSGALRLRQGNRLVSPLNLSRILNLALQRHVEDLMGTAAHTLKYQTGRLAASAQITSLEFNKAEGRQRKHRMGIGFAYALAPYEVFEPGHRMHKQGRSPTALIRSAIREALIDALTPASYLGIKFDIFRRDI